MVACLATPAPGLDGSTVVQPVKGFLIYMYKDPGENRSQESTCMFACMEIGCAHRRHWRPLWFHDEVALMVRPAHTRRPPGHERAGAASSLASCPATLMRRSGTQKALSTFLLWPMNGCSGCLCWLRHPRTLTHQRMAYQVIPPSSGDLWHSPCPGGTRVRENACHDKTKP